MKTHPEKHTVHCLVDIPRCVNSGYVILTNQGSNQNPDYVASYYLSESGNAQALAFAQDLKAAKGGMEQDILVTVEGSLDADGRLSVTSMYRGIPSPLTFLTPPTYISSSPSISPSQEPSDFPTNKPSYLPSLSPTSSPSRFPSSLPTDRPTAPAVVPSKRPSSSPTPIPSTSPTLPPNNPPTQLPSSSPTPIPSTSPTLLPTNPPTQLPSLSPSQNPTANPTHQSSTPSLTPTSVPTPSPTVAPTSWPSRTPSTSPTSAPSRSPSFNPTATPTLMPTTASPTTLPTSAPAPTSMPSSQPTTGPTTVTPSSVPSWLPTSLPTQQPSRNPTKACPVCPVCPVCPRCADNICICPSCTSNPTPFPSRKPTPFPSRTPTKAPSTRKPTGLPTRKPTRDPNPLCRLDVSVYTSGCARYFSQRMMVTCGLANSSQVATAALCSKECGSVLAEGPEICPEGFLLSNTQRISNVRTGVCFTLDILVLPEKKGSKNGTAPEASDKSVPRIEAACAEYSSTEAPITAALVVFILLAFALAGFSTFLFLKLKKLEKKSKELGQAVSEGRKEQGAGRDRAPSVLDAGENVGLWQSPSTQQPGRAPPEVMYGSFELSPSDDEKREFAV
eukprot:CAMPEP_0175119866 /NCGR_PEP_ID=MMETSP0087-20121206/306_1 /TAXON_ID=136419 /ORGANISM="Unknown Unknown, Strain D1" /LENGTH=615 /DNA_ID=CAMNT_0016401255 /DNA_START=68 /DNA_END=1915 /DNA_ORIENTATION=+